MKKKLYLIDGNAYIYRAFYALPVLTTSHNIQVNAVYGFLRMMIKILHRDMPSYCVVCFDPPTKTFRHDLFDQYKAHRPKMAPELVSQIPLVKEAVTAMGLHQLEVAGFEADDVIATLTKRALREDLEVVIVSGDKDMLQLVASDVTVYAEPNEIIFDRAKVEEKYKLSPEQIRDFFALVGDSSDNVPGVAGIGKVSATSLLQKHGSIKDMLAHLEKIDPKARAKIEASKENLMMSYELIGLIETVPFEFDYKNYQVEKWDDEKRFLPFLEKLELNALIKQLYGKDSEADKHRASLSTVSYTEHQKIENITEKIFSIILEKKDGEITGLVIFTSPSDVWHLTISEYEKWKNDFEKILKNLDIVLLVEDVKELATFLKKHDIVCRTSRFFDVVAAAYLLDSGIRKLEDVVKKHLEIFFEKTNMFDRARMVYEVYPLLASTLIERNLDLWYRTTELPFCDVLAAMEEKGILIDKAYLIEFSKNVAVTIEKQEEKIFNDAGQKFNINSPKQLARVLFEKLGLPVLSKTKTGPSTSESVLERLSHMHPLPRKIMAYREQVKLKTTYLDVLPNLADAEVRVHTSFNYTNTATGRLSSSSPNMQNIPTKTDIGRSIRKGFIASEGYSLVSADYAQIDLVMLAHISKDEAMCNAFLNYKDIHTRTASEIFKISEDSVTKEQRTIAKRINFGLVYGMSPYGLSKDLGIALDEAKAFIDAYFANYPNVMRYREEIVAFARDHGYVETIIKRRRYIPEIKSHVHSVRTFGERIAINTPIQGSSADCIKKAMVDLAEVLIPYGRDVAMLLQIHDEIIFEIKDSLLEKLVPVIRNTMEHSSKLSVPLSVDIKAGKHWEEIT